MRLRYTVETPAGAAPALRSFSVWVVWGSGWSRNLGAISSGSGGYVLRAGWGVPAQKQARDTSRARLLPGRTYRVDHRISGGVSGVWIDDELAIASGWLKDGVAVARTPAVIPAGTVRIETGYRTGENQQEAPWPGLRLLDVRLEVRR
jgi:hypothetical protein